MVMNELLDATVAESKPLLFMKHMAHHLIDIDRGFLKQTKNVLLIRNPQEMLPSLTIQLPNATLADTGLEVQSELFKTLQERGAEPLVIDSRDVLRDPAGMLSALCRHLAIEFQSSMLHWPKGGIAEDGIWARHWYHAVHKSTGFAQYVQKGHFPEALKGLLDTCSPYYERLYRHAVRVNAGD
jgi:hypothetical protein